ISNGHIEGIKFPPGIEIHEHIRTGLFLTLLTFSYLCARFFEKRRPNKFMASTADIRNGLCIEFNNDIYSIVEFQHVKPGKGNAFVRTKLKSVTTGKVVDHTFPAGHKIDTV